MALICALIVLAVAACTSGGGTATVSPSGSAAGIGAPSTSLPAIRWQALSAHNDALGTWSYGGSLVVAANTQVTAYNQVTGAVLWRTKAPVIQGHATVFCGASPSMSGSAVVLGIGVPLDSTGVDTDCHSIIAFNVATGHLGWLDVLPSYAEQVTYGNSLAGQPGLVKKGMIVDVSGQTVVAGWMGVLAGFSLTTGTREWKTVLGGEANFGNYVVKDIAIAGASTYAVVSEVLPASMRLYRIGTATGTVTRKITLTKSMTGEAYPLAAAILSAAPLVVAVEQVEPAFFTNIVSFGRTLAAAAVLHGQHLFTAPSLGDDEAHQFYPFAIGDGMLAAVTAPPGNALVAFSLTTGAKEWTAALPGAGFFYPVAVSGPVVQAVGLSQSGQGDPLLVSVDAATGKVLSTGPPRTFGPVPLSGQAEAGYRYVPAGGHVYGVYWSSSKTTPGSAPAVFSLG